MSTELETSLFYGLLAGVPVFIVWSVLFFVTHRLTTDTFNTSIVYGVGSGMVVFVICICYYLFNP